MSLREKAREVKEAAEAERGNFDPQGAPLRSYQYWVANTNSRKGKDIRHGDRRENFCHFWRVVLFWSPFMRVRKAIGAVANNEYFQMGVIALLVLVVLAGTVLGALTSEAVLLGLIIGVVGAYLISGIVVGATLAVANLDDRTVWKRIAMATFPTSLPTYGLVKAGAAVSDDAWETIFGIVLVVSGVVATACAIGAAFVAWGWWAPVYIGGGLLIVAAAILAVSFVGDLLSGLRKRAQAASLRRAENRVEDGEDVEPKAPRVPSKFEVLFNKFLDGLSRFGRTLGDYIILGSQIVRVKKWKICPLVNVPNTALSYNYDDEKEYA